MADTHTDSKGLAEPLTEREQEILAWLAHGLSNREIADRLHLAHRTVTWYNTQIYSKLGVNNRDDAVIRAQELGLSGPSNHTPADANTRHNLPHQTTPFIGRQQELDDLARLMANPDARLITILAPGGMGKTRLGLAAAERQLHHFADGVFFVPLAPLSSPDDIVTAIAENVGLSFFGGDPPSQQLLGYLRDQHMLLVLDNFEHLLGGATQITDLLQAAPRAKVLVTSREKLKLSGEIVLTLVGMHLPDWGTADDLFDYDAIQLFIESAKRVRPDLELQESELTYLARICRMTEGMPLALVLAAGWLDVLTLEQIVAEIQQGISILETEMRDVPERQRSVQATFNYSWGRLTEPHRDVFMKLSVFRSGFTVEAAEVVAGADLRKLRKLVDKALVQALPTGRYDMHELVRQFGASKLDESIERATVQAKHAVYFAEFMVKQEWYLKNGEQLKALILIDHDFENVRLAWHYLVNHHQWDQLPKFRYGFWFHCIMRSRGHDVIALLDYARQILNTVTPSAVVKLTIGRMIAWSSWFYSDLGNNDRASECAEEAIAILQPLEDNTADLIIAYYTLERIAIYHAEDRASALSMALENCRRAQALGDPVWLGLTAIYLAFISDPDKATDSIYQAKAWFEEAGDRHGLWVCSLGEAQILIQRDQLQEANTMLRYGESLIAPFKSAWHLALTNNMAGIVNLKQHNNVQAYYHFTVALQLLWEAGYHYGVYGPLLRIAQMHILENNLEMAIAIMWIIEDAPPALRNPYRNFDELINARIDYDEVRLQLNSRLRDEQLENLWEQVQKPVLSGIINQLLAELAEA